MTKTTAKSTKKKQRRLSQANRNHHVDQVAEILVACGESRTKTAERVRELIPSLGRFVPHTLTDWASSVDWQRALKAARENAAIKKDLDERQRGRIIFRSGLEMLKYLTEELERAIEKREMETVCRLQDRMAKLNKSLLEEEKHLAQSEKQETDDEPAFTMIYDGPEEETVPPDEI